MRLDGIASRQLDSRLLLSTLVLVALILAPASLLLRLLLNIVLSSLQIVHFWCQILLCLFLSRQCIIKRLNRGYCLLIISWLREHFNLVVRVVLDLNLEPLLFFSPIVLGATLLYFFVVKLDDTVDIALPEEAFIVDSFDALASAYRSTHI